MLVDLDYFYAQCEEIRNPELKNKPIVICVYSGRSSDSGAVSTCNYIARHEGVKSGIPIILAKQILKNREDAVFLPTDYEYYEEISERIMNILRGYSDAFEQASIDEAYLDISKATGGSFNIAESSALKIQEDLMRAEKMTCTIGIAPDKITAKIAADIKKPNSLTVVRPENLQNFLSPLPVSKLHGVGVKTNKRLKELNIHTIGDLAKTRVEKLVDVFGKKLGVYFYSASNGTYHESVQERDNPEQISRIVTLKKDSRDIQLLSSIINDLSNDLHQSMQQSGLWFRTVSINAVLEDLSTLTRSKSLDSHTSEIKVIKKMANMIISDLLNEVEQKKVRRVGVKLSELIKNSGQTSISNFIS